MIFFCRAVWGLGTFSLDPLAVSFSRRQPSNEYVFTANVLYFCNLPFCPSTDVTMNPLWGFCSVYLKFYTYWCVFSSKPWFQISLCACVCASIEGICYWYISPRPINIFTWKVRRAECDIRQQELSEFYKQAENYCCKTKSWPSYVL